MNRKVETIHLNEQDSKNFTRAFWCPTHEEIEENKRKLQEIRQLVVTDMPDGFKTEIEDIDIQL